jgi:hypothetical protein
VVAEGAGEGETKRLQEAAVPPANYVHPEFGYLCPTSRLRRDFRVAVVSIVLGGIIGAAVVTLRAAHDREADNALMVAHVVHPTEATAAAVAEAAPGATDVGNVKLEPVKIDRIRIDAVKADTAEPVTDGAKIDGAKTDGAKTDGSKIDRAKRDSAKADSGKTDAAKGEGAKADAAKPACEDNTWAYLDGTCVAIKPRRVKVRAATDSPGIGAAPIGRTVSTNVAAPAPAAANAPSSSAPPAATSNATAPATATASPETPQPSAAPTRKPQKVVRSQSRPSHDRSARDERVRGYAGYANYPGYPGGYRQGANPGLFGWVW